DFHARLKANSEALGRAQEIKDLAGDSLTNQLVQETVVQSILIDADNYAQAPRKIRAYDANAAALRRIRALSDSPRLVALIDDLTRLDEEERRAADSEVLETLAAGDRPKAQWLYANRYKPLMARSEELIRELVAAADERAARATEEIAADNER